MDIVTYALLNGKIKNYASNVDEWLEENVDPTTGYVLDRSLQMENAAAPADMVGDINDEVGDLKNTLSHKADVIYDTASGDIASFPDGADGLPVKDLTVGIEPVQSGTGDPSPTNVRPISGRTGCNVTRTGVNVWDEEIRNGYLTPSGGFVANSSYITAKNFVSVVPNTTYAFVNLASKLGRICWYNENKEFISTESAGTATVYVPTAPSNARYLLFDMQGAYGDTYNHDVSINYPSTDHDYHPGTGNVTIPISWQSSAGTVYGGTLDVTSGVLTVDRAGVDVGTLAFVKDSAGYFQTAFGETAFNDARHYTSVETADIMCSQYTAAPVGQITRFDAVIGIYWYESDSRNILRIKDDNYAEATVQEFTAAMSGVIAVYPLATPRTYQLTPIEVTTLLGQNNIWADCGPSTVEYPCDTKLYIQKINTPTDDDMIADANIASGQYFIVNNNLYISTTTILAGDPIKPGTNCTLTNLAAALNAINS